MVLTVCICRSQGLEVAERSAPVMASAWTNSLRCAGEKLDNFKIIVICESLNFTVVLK